MYEVPAGSSRFYIPPACSYTLMSAGAGAGHSRARMPGAPTNRADGFTIVTAAWTGIFVPGRPLTREHRGRRDIAHVKLPPFRANVGDLT